MSANYLTAFLIVSSLIYLLCLAAGGAFGARVAHGPAGKGALAAMVAGLLQMGVSWQFEVENVVLQYSLVVLFLILVGSRLWLKLTAGQIAGIALGSFLFPAAAVGVYFYVAQGL